MHRHAVNTTWWLLSSGMRWCGQLGSHLASSWEVELKPFLYAFRLMNSSCRCTLSHKGRLWPSSSLVELMVFHLIFSCHIQTYLWGCHMCGVLCCSRTPSGGLALTTLQSRSVALCSQRSSNRGLCKTRNTSPFHAIGRSYYFTKPISIIFTL